MGDTLLSIAEAKCADDCFELINDRDDVRPITQRLAARSKNSFSKISQEYDQTATAKLLSSEEVEASLETDAPKVILGLFLRTTQFSDLLGLRQSLGLVHRFS